MAEGSEAVHPDVGNVRAKNGNWLFVNIQSPGVTFAITGPWRKGTL